MTLSKQSFRLRIPFPLATKMSHRAAISISLILLMASATQAQVLLSPAFRSTATDTRTVTPSNPAMILFGQDQPDPLLRYRLWPAPEQRRPRNAMVAVNRALLLVGQVSSADKRNFLDRFEEWKTLPLDQLPVVPAKTSCQPFDTAIEVLRNGENWMDLRYDLGIEEMSVREKMSTLLPEFQETRDLARLISMRARVAAAEHRWDDAITDLRLGFRLGEITSHATNTLLGRLIGIAICEVQLDTIEAMIVMPDCPNLYWALVALPVDRLFEMRAAIEYESTLAYDIGTMAGLGDLQDEVIGEQESLRRIKELTDLYSAIEVTPDSSQGSLALRQLSTGVQVMMMVQPARTLLSESKHWQDRVHQLSDAEVVLRASALELSRIRDRTLAWSLIPSELWSDCASARDAGLSVPSQPVTLGGQLARVVLPSVAYATRAGLYAKQSHHRLVTLEAIRMHAAHAGELPQSIEQLTPVPAWHDPISQKPFSYALQSPTIATLMVVPGNRSRLYPTTTINLKTIQ